MLHISLGPVDRLPGHTLRRASSNSGATNTPEETILTATYYQMSDRGMDERSSMLTTPATTRSRSLVPELMDDPGLDASEHDAALQGLARLNRVSGIHATVWRAVTEMAGNAPCTLVDVAAGSGDLIVTLGRRARARGVPMALTACDISPVACDSIKSRADAAGLAVSVERVDALNGTIEAHDFAMCHLFLHHLESDAIVTLLRRLRQIARRGIVITDLTRTRMGYALAWAASRGLTRSRVVHVDALLSVRAALTPTELRSLAAQAGLDDARVRRIWPERMLLTWEASR